MKYTLHMTLCVVIALAATACTENKPQHIIDAERTAKRAVVAINPFAKKRKDVFVEPRHYDYSIDVSHWETQHEFPTSWDGQEWDQEYWKEGTHPDEVVLNLFKGEIFKTHFMKKGSVPILVVGKNFYNISDLDRKRSVEFFAERSRILKKGYKTLTLMDWDTQEVIGTYSEKGLFLN